MPVKLEDRPIAQVREETIDKLIVNYSHDVISQEAFERRLDAVMATESHQEMVDLVADLPLAADSEYQQRKEATLGKREHREPESKVTCILSNTSRKGFWEVPERLKVVDVLGSITLDFTEAQLPQRHVEIALSSFLGSVSIVIPEHFSVTSRVGDVLGSSEAYVPPSDVETSHIITVTGWSVLGSVDVSVKRNLRERWVAFANAMRETFGMGQRNNGDSRTK
ncbi:LiaF domain-containing protein [Pseudidiomarina insulisalsae]|uniref:Cell wall-active antibiotics response LiaF-like C-terminal domain-containing protein n=1 Tax=Pseudidiomarina insulisalsae TaxID=575789 RepID=A0A432YAF0_9GAMM|nr:LiaF domain-containing protein [Pseudidiomarina insulisalsae]RUO57917.1 hypothetical protein CWI71_10940 [Pseudidiomarina insulisalsae]